jgi:hypothetical protein
VSIFFDVKQGTHEWALLRLGVPTSSAFGRIITPSKHDFSASAITYIGELIQERLAYPDFPPRVENFGNRAMEYGVINEESACRAYSLMTGNELAHGGFYMTNDRRFGSSPDRRVITDSGTVAGLTEMKCPLGKTHMKWLLGPGDAAARSRWESLDKLPLDHLCQCHGELIVSELPWVDFFSCADACQDICIRVVPNAFTLKMRVALERFWKLYISTLEGLAIKGTEKVQALYEEKRKLV